MSKKNKKLNKGLNVIGDTFKNIIGRFDPNFKKRVSPRSFSLEVISEHLGNVIKGLPSHYNLKVEDVIKEIGEFERNTGSNLVDTIFNPFMCYFKEMIEDQKKNHPKDEIVSFDSMGTVIYYTILTECFEPSPINN